MGFFSPFQTFESRLPPSTVIGPQPLRDELEPCRACGTRITTHGYEFAGKVKLRGKAATEGSTLLCPSCYITFAKRNYLNNTLREVSPIFIGGAVICGIVAGIFSSIVWGIIAGVLALGWLVAGISRLPLIEKVEYQLLCISSGIASLPYSGPPQFTMEDVEDAESHGMPWFYSPREQVVPNPIAVFVHKDNPVKDVSIDCLSRIFTGAARSWNEFGWEDVPIKTLGPKEPCRETGAFRRIVLRWGACSLTETLPISLGVPSKVANERGAIGFTIYSHHEKATEIYPVRLLAVERENCSFDNADYPLWATQADSFRKVHSFCTGDRDRPPLDDRQGELFPQPDTSSITESNKPAGGDA
jgi:hypothetical protein